MAGHAAAKEVRGKYRAGEAAASIAHTMSPMRSVLFAAHMNTTGTFASTLVRLLAYPAWRARRRG